MQKGLKNSLENCQPIAAHSYEEKNDLEAVAGRLITEQTVPFSASVLRSVADTPQR